MGTSHLACMGTSHLACMGTTRNASRFDTAVKPKLKKAFFARAKMKTAVKLQWQRPRITRVRAELEFCRLVDCSGAQSLEQSTRFS